MGGPELTIFRPVIDFSLPLLSAVMVANLLSAAFLYGMVKASKINGADSVSLAVVLCLLIPLMVLSSGAYMIGADMAAAKSPAIIEQPTKTKVYGKGWSIERAH